MENENIVQFTDKVIKLLQLGNIPKSIQELESVRDMLQRDIVRRGGKRFQLINIPQMTETELKNPLLQRDFELANKLNEVLSFLNSKFGKVDHNG